VAVVAVEKELVAVAQEDIENLLDQLQAVTQFHQEVLLLLFLYLFQCKVIQLQLVLEELLEIHVVLVLLVVLVGLEEIQYFQVSLLLEVEVVEVAVATLV
jgi:hypothetical protein